MANSSALRLLLLVLMLCVRLLAQQLGADPSEYPRLSAQCQTAVNVSVRSCPDSLRTLSDGINRASINQTLELCTEECLHTLLSAQQVIHDTCNLTTDVIVADTVQWPAFFLVDKYVHAYNVSCRKDSKTGRFCTEIFAEALQIEKLTDDQLCSDCFLGVAQFYQSSPFNYHPQLDSQLDQMITHCNATSYTHATPTPYATTTIISMPSVMKDEIVCLRPYQIAASDTCDSIATTQNVSTFSIENAAGGSCRGLPVNRTICLEEPHRIYKVRSGDTCLSIMAAHGGLREYMLAYWNPNINRLCTNLGKLVNTWISVSASMPERKAHKLAESSVTVSTRPTAALRPTNAPTESNDRCSKWYIVQEGDYCWKVTIKFNIPLDDFKFLNPEIDANCTNLLLGLAYCVSPLGDTATYSGYTTRSPIFTLDPVTWRTASVSYPVAPTPIATSLSQLPLAPGTLSNCTRYVDYKSIPPVVDQSQEEIRRYVNPQTNQCNYILAGSKISMEDFLHWNPSLNGSNPCSLQQGYRYCKKLLPDTPDPPRPPYVPKAFCEAPSHILPGTNTNCSCYKVLHGDDCGGEGCAWFAEIGNTTIDELVQWNTWLAPDCDAGLYKDFAEDDNRALCIAVPTSAATSEE